MTGRERYANILQHKPVDRIGLYEHFWNDTEKAWREAGKIKAGEQFEDVFPFDMTECGGYNLMARLDFEPIVVAETEDTITLLDGNGATLRRHKKHDTTPEHIDYQVTDRASWEELVKPLLTPDPKRINFEGYRAARKRAAEQGRYFLLSAINVFENIHPVCGHVNMLIGMAEDPKWVLDMSETFAQLHIDLQEQLFAKEGAPDGIWYYEDMGYKGSPFMSPAMYHELIKPAHDKTFAYAHSKGLPVTVHSCGYIEPLIPGLIDAGMDCLEVIEVKAGMDLLKLHKLYGEKIALMGGIDVRALYTNDRAVIDAELEAKIPEVMKGYGYVLHSDHSIPSTVDFETFEYFIEKGLALGTY